MTQPTGSAAAGRTALVTGAGNGLGRAIARALADAGARTILVGRHVSKLEAVAVEIDRSGGVARVATADTGSPEEVDLLRAALADGTFQSWSTTPALPVP